MPACILTQVINDVEHLPPVVLMNVSTSLSFDKLGSEGSVCIDVFHRTRSSQILVK